MGRRENRYYTPYGIDIPYEIKTYAHVGCDYVWGKRTKYGFINRIHRYYRKLTNRKEKKYKILHTYSEWRKHIICVLDKEILNYLDLIHWLMLRKRSAKYFLTAVKVLLIPIYIAIPDIFSIWFGEETGKISILVSSFLLFFICLISSIVLRMAYDEVNFFDEVIEIAEEVYRMR